MKRSILILSVFISFIAASLAFITADEPQYKNLKILKKNINKKEMDSVMHFFSASMGEKCNFCHVRNEAAKTMDFASDGNPNKNVARSMMRMTAKLNKKYFKNEESRNNHAIQAVTCYTCHHGNGHPATKPGAMHGDNMGNPPGGMRPSSPGDSNNLRRDSDKNMSTDSTKSGH